ncbi:MAG: MBL fold metallo-hydrolase [Bacillota bacterium]|nr:MBL fold metallo-hydrolase [Bacillota bacterium]
MQIQKIKNRNILFTYDEIPEWDLNLHLILGRKYNYIIDTGLGAMSVEPIKEYIKNDTKPLIVINTHHDWDHIWGNGEFKDSIIISHRLCRELMEAKWDKMLSRNGRYIYGKVEKQLPSLTFENELYFPEDRIRIIYTPGHTVDSISVLDEEDKVLNAGDNIGDTVDEIVPEISADKVLYIDTLLSYRELDFDTCVSGHNVVLGKEVIEEILGKI